MADDERRTTESRSTRSNRDLDDFAAARRARRKGSRWKRPRRILGMWARVALLVGVVVVTVFVAIGLVAKAVRPYNEAGVQNRQLADTRLETDALDRENAELARRIAYLKTPEGVASEARKMGYLRPGEIPLVVEGQAGQPKPGAGFAAPLDAPTPAPTGSAARRFWRHLTGH